LYANVSGLYPALQRDQLRAPSGGNISCLCERQRIVRWRLLRRSKYGEIAMSFIEDLKKYAIARLKDRRHRQTVSFLNSLPGPMKKDIGWNGDLDRRFE
jgi:hypothetical protein